VANHDTKKKLNPITIILFIFALLITTPVLAGTPVYTNYIQEQNFYVTNDTSHFLFLNGSRPMEGNLSMHGFAINNVRNVSDPSDATNVSWVQNLVWNNGTIATDTDLLQYYLIDTSRALTGSNVRRDINNDLLYLWGGDTSNPQGGQIQLYGGANPALDGGMAFAVGDAGGVFLPVMWIEGTTNTPHLDMLSHQIKGLLDPTAAQDAVTLNYLTTHPSAPSAAQLNDYYTNDTSKLLWGEHLKRQGDNNFLALYGGEAIAGGTGILSVFGKTSGNPSAIEAIVGDAAGTGNIILTGWKGGDAPRMDMMGYNITGIMTITNESDAVNKTYVDTRFSTNATSGGTGGQIIYFNHSASSDIAGFEGLGYIPAGNVEADETVVVNSGLGQVIVDPYVTILGQPGITNIPAGLWRFRTFHYVSHAGGNTNAVFKVYKRSAAGAETLLFSATSEDINALAVQEYLTSYAQATDIPLLTTDRIEIKVYGQSTSASNKDFHFVYDGSIHTSHVLTSISTLSSLDNYAYLPGRAGGQFWNCGINANENCTINASLNGGNVFIQPYNSGAVGSNYGHVVIGSSVRDANLDAPLIIERTGGNRMQSFIIADNHNGRFEVITSTNSPYTTEVVSGNVQVPLGIGSGLYGKALMFGTNQNTCINCTDPTTLTKTFQVGNTFYVDNLTGAIGTLSPYTNLESANSFRINASAGGAGLNIMSNSLTSNKMAIYFRNTTRENWRIIDDTGSALIDNLQFLTNAGGTAVLTLKPSAAVQINSFAAGTVMSDASGNLYVVSDEKFKTDIAVFSSGLAEVLKINPINYKFNSASGLDTTNTYTGFSAQQLRTAIPEAVYEKPNIKYEQVLKSKGKDGAEDEYEQIEVPVLDKDGKQTTTLSVSDRPIIAAEINAIKELNAKIEAQNKTINDLTARIEKLEATKVKV
jgi:hypothetical protein